jgi:hypothetical protein
MSRREHTEPARHDRRARRPSPAIAPPVPVPAPPADPARGHVLLDEPVVAALQAVRDYPCASVLMSTAPGNALSSVDAARLDRLVAAAGRRLRTEVAHHPIEPVLARLQRLSVDARSVATGRSVALFASFHHDALVVVPVDVVDRVVVDPTFATRDLVRGLAARPRVRVVVVSERTVRLLEGCAGALVEIDLALPEVPSADGSRGGRGRRNRPAAEDRRRDATRLRHVAAAVHARQSVDPLPVVVAGVTRQIAAWTSEFGDDGVVGTIPGSHDVTPIARLDALAAPVIDAHRRRERRAALARLRATDPARSAVGIDQVWSAAGAGRIELLCVEEGYVYPARPDHAHGRLRPADALECPEVLDDAVDEVIEMVRLGDGRVVTVGDGALEGCGRIAARLRW